MGRGSNESNDNDWFGPTSDIVNKIYPDVIVRNEGSVFLFTPLTPALKTGSLQTSSPTHNGSVRRSWLSIGTPLT